MERVLADIKAATLAQRQQNGVNGVGVNGKAKAKAKSREVGGAGQIAVDMQLALPQSVVTEGVKVVKECLEQVCHVE